MALDPQIILGIQPQTPTPIGTQVAQAGQTLDTLAIARQRVQAAKDQAAINTALQQSNGDPDAAVKFLNQSGSGTAALALSQKVEEQRKTVSERIDQQLKQQRSELDMASSLVNAAKGNPQAYGPMRAAILGMAQSNPDSQKALAALLPENANPDDIPSILDRVSMLGVSAKDQFDAHEKAQELFRDGKYGASMATALAATPVDQRAGLLKLYKMQGVPDDVLAPFAANLQADPDTIRSLGLNPAEQATIGHQKALEAQAKASEANVTASLAERTRHDQVMEAKPVGGALGAQQSDPKDIADAIARGEQPPTLTGMYRDAAPIRAELARQGYPLAKATEDWNATQKYLGTLNGVQQTRLRQAIQFTNESIPNIRNLITQWDSSGLPLLSKANLDAAASGAKGQAAQSLAVRLKGQVADLTSELGTVYKGGNSSTDESLKLAAQNLQADWSKKAALDALGQIEQNIHIRQNSMQNVSPITNQGNQYQPDTKPAPKQASTGAIPPKNASQGDTWMSPTGLRVWDAAKQKWVVGG